MKKITTIAFDGIHRTGKGTQILKLKQYLEKLGKKVYVVRGDGSRSGDNKKPYFDPYSKFFKNFSNNKGNKTLNEWKEASNRIQRELVYWKYKLEKEYGKYIVLLDRSIISRAILDLNTSEEELLTYIDGSGKVKKRILPDIIFSFQAKTDILLSRLYLSEKNNFSQLEIRRKNIIEKNDKYNNIIKKLPNVIKDRIIYIDASNKIDVIFEEIKERIGELLKI